MNLLDEATFQNTLDIRNNIPWRQRCPDREQKRYEQDPYLLQHIMDEKLSGYDMPTTDRVNTVFQKVKGLSGY